jgi:hypothetical protein
MVVSILSPARKYSEAPAAASNTSAKTLPSQLCRYSDGSIHSGFVIWQKVYADRGIATFPVRIGTTKKPMVRGYPKVGPDLSAEWAQEFPFAPAFGLNLGPKEWHTNRRGERLPPASGLTEVDIDTPAENILADALDRHGDTPIVIRTASRKFKAWYRHNGEKRLIRPFPGLPIDLLGGGFTVPPPSFNADLSAQYEFIAGNLDDIGRLPVMRNLDPALYRVKAPRERAKKADSLASPLSGMRDGDGRNNALLRAIGPTAREIYAEGGTRERLLEVAVSHNNESAEPMAIEEVNQVVGNVWKMTTEHRNWIGRGGERRTELASFSGDVDAWFLLEFLRVSEGASAVFWIANGLAENFGWTRQRFVQAREHLIDLGYIAKIKKAWSTSPAEYIWA